MKCDFPLSRRALLRGTGAALALPWLEAMTPRSSAAAKAGTPALPVRMAALYMPNGVHPDMWTPNGTGREFELSPTLAPLNDLKNEILVLTNLWNQASVGGDGHYVKISGWLTSTTINKTLGVDISCNGTSMDQVAAQKAGKQTPLASLELGVSPVTTGVDKNVGYTRVYGSHIAWAGPTTPLAREINPRLVFERLLRATKPQADSAKSDKLLLDRVLDDARELRDNLGTADRHRLDEYLSVVRSLEERIERASAPERSTWKPRVALNPADKPSDPKEFADHVRLMMDMIALAFQSDTTRIVTFMFGNEVSNQNFAFVDGVKDAHHTLSHHQKDADKLRQYQIINRWHVEQYAYLLRKLRDMKEGESNVLENSMILFGSGIRDGNRHDPHNLPLVLGGRGRRKIATGQHLSYSPDTPLSNLYVCMLDAFGTPVERFADSTGKLTGVMA
ncbi:MAG TPA: DUF1552 domain-containing protein [Bryobacteraceae bacterium]|nr:DUF1552 domain-containing protein [Bryobacteraceae bacterium]